MKFLKIFSLIIIALTILHAEPPKKDTSDIEKEIRASETIEKQKETINALEKRITLLEQNNSLQQENMLVKKESLDSSITTGLRQINIFGTLLTIIITIAGLFLGWLGLRTKSELKDIITADVNTKLSVQVFEYKESLKVQMLKDIESEVERQLETQLRSITPSNSTPTGGNPDPFERN